MVNSSYFYNVVLPKLPSDPDSGWHKIKKNQLHCAAEFSVPAYSNLLPFSTLAKPYLQDTSENMKTK